mgnify:CR=1 FL=1
MFKKIKCEHCKNMYDETFCECPNCHAKNEKLDPNFKKLTMLSIPKQIAFFLVGLLGFEILGLLISYILYITGFVDNYVELAPMLLNTLVYVILFGTLFGIANVDIKKLFSGFKKWQPYVAGLCCFFAIILLGMFYSIILDLIDVEIVGNTNQESIDSTALSFPLTSIIIFGFIGPICEELTYRVGLFSFLKRISKWVAYPVTIIVFTLIHFDFGAETMANELLNLPYYIFAAFLLTFTYDKFGFAGSATAHVLNNVISLIPMTVALGVFH